MVNYWRARARGNLHVHAGDDGQFADVVQPISQDKAKPNKDLVGIDAFDIVAGLRILLGEPVTCLRVDKWPHDS